MADSLNVVLAQLNLLVGDIDGNAERIITSAKQAFDNQSAHLIVFPELTLTGYPPEDLLIRPSLQARIERALEKILEADLPGYIVVGFPEQVNCSLYNTLALIKGRERLATYHKQCLPNYQVFDERRYFKPGNDGCVFQIHGTRVAFTICEDMWELAPVVQAREAGAQLLININASPFHINKLEERQQLLQQRATEGGVPVIYVNLVGGQDELVFDGGSMAINSDGTCQFLAPSYIEGNYFLKVNVGANGSCQIPEQNIASNHSLEEQVYDALVLGVRDYVNKNNFPGVVLGLSGGIDSSLTLAIAVDALGKERVQAVMMPFEYTSQLSINAAAQQAALLGVNYKVIAIHEIYSAFMDALAMEFAGSEIDVSEQNIQARARGVILMAISNKKGSLVLTTGNKSEIAVGYTTLYGDMAGGFNPLKDVSKTLVYKLSSYRNTGYGPEPDEVIPTQVIERAPSAELAPGQIDQDNLPPYDILDQILELYVENDCSADAIVAEGFDEVIVRKIVRMVDLNEYKRRQSPIGVRLTKRGFGRDRRYPITNSWPMGD
ncbi:MAG TPA: NAD+ synthase [Gammaproteobacteria bacterium]|nr:NAD+ synthase [Gammaproteobacteria bacterium]